jgi:hypothetical protein
VNREKWLIEATGLLELEFFNKPIRALPKKLALSCGIPKGSSRAIGQCWDPRVSSDGTTHIFICPSLDDPLQILATLLHELIHACVGIQERHGGNFAKMARWVGLEGKLTATTVSEGTKLHKKLTTISERLGPYPHKAMQKNRSVAIKKKGQSKRIKLVSTTEDSYSLTISIKVFEEFGSPQDPWGNPMVPLDS